MQPAELIDKINSSNKLADIVSLDTYRDEYKRILMEIHPDKCNLPGAKEATAIMTGFIELHENGKSYIDDIGEYKTNYYWLNLKSSEPNLNWSIENYRLFMQLQEPSDKNFQRYLPNKCFVQVDGGYQFQFDKRAIPLTNIKLSQEHVNWIINRLFEYCAYLQQIKFVHCGLTPESIFIVPETHGIQIVSFYHLTRIGAPIKTISGGYTSWYPNTVFRNKVAQPIIDIEMVKHLAAYLLGSPSGNAASLRKTHNESYINFLLTMHTNAYQCMMEYKEMIKANYESKFYELHI